MDDETQKIVAMYQEGLSLKSIGEKLGRSHQYAYRRLKKYSVTLRPMGWRGPGHGQWKGRRLKANEGYIRIWISGTDQFAIMRNHQGYVLEHRLMMARSLGRSLSQIETVHHINGIKEDNRIENLQLRRGKHGKGTALCCANCGSYNIVETTLAEN